MQAINHLFSEASTYPGLIILVFIAVGVSSYALYLLIKVIVSFISSMFQAKMSTNENNHQPAKPLL